MSEERNYEAEASEQGWTPKEGWKGPEEKWTDAQTFVERGEQIAGILKSKNAKLESRIHNLEESNKQFGEYHKQTLETQKKRTAETIAGLEAELAQAVTDGDGQAYTKLNRDIDSLKSEQPVQADNAQVWNQMSQAWIADNQWYSQNQKLQSYADGVSDRIRSVAVSDEDYFSKLTANVRENFPEEFKNPNKAKANAVDEGGQKGSNNSKEHTFENLPPEAKAAFAGFHKDFGMTKEDYVENYEFED